MIPCGVEIFMALVPIDLRWGFDRLVGVVKEQIGHDARDGALFLFFGRRRHALKILFFDGTGLCIFYKRLDKGLFRLPTAATDSQLPTVTLNERELAELLDGIDLEKPARRRCGREKRIIH